MSEKFFFNSKDGELSLQKRFNLSPVTEIKPNLDNEIKIRM
jgi:hypothetical protein